MDEVQNARKTFRKQLNRVLFFPFFLMVLVSAALFSQLREMAEVNRWVDHADSGISQIQSVLTLLLDLETGMRGYVISGSREFLEPYRFGSQRIDGAVAKLDGLFRDDPRATRTMTAFHDALHRWRRFSDDVIEHARTGKANASEIRGGRGKALMDKMRRDLGDLLSRQEMLRQMKLNDSRLMAQRLLLFGPIGLLGIAIPLGMYSRRKFYQISIAYSRALVQERTRRIELEEIERHLREAEEKQRHLLESEKSAKAQLERALRSRDEFLGIASHELRTPITSLKLQVQLLARSLRNGGLERVPEERIRRMLETSDRQVENLGHLINDLLDVSQIVNGRLRLSPEWADLGAVIQEVVDQFSEQIRISGSSVSLRFDGDLHGYWDTRRIQQVVVNLLSNALKYGAGRPISIECSRKDHVLRMEFRDHGHGIEPSNFERIFDRFERVVTAQNISGLGLGLFISREIVRAHGGRITVESEPGKGSVFTVVLPPAIPTRRVA